MKSVRFCVSEVAYLLMFVVLTAVPTKRSTFSEVTLYTSLQVYPTFQRNMLPLPSVSKSICMQLICFGLLFDPEDTFLRNVCKIAPDYTGSHPTDNKYFLFRRMTAAIADVLGRKYGNETCLFTSPHAQYEKELRSRE
jgi:hypothetical protein